MGRSIGNADHRGWIYSPIEIIPLELNEGNEKEYGDAIEFREKRGFSDVATGPKAAKILNRFKDLSAKYDTSVKIKGEKAIIEIQSSSASEIIKNVYISRHFSGFDAKLE